MSRKARDTAEAASPINLKEIAIEEPEDGVFDAYSNVVQLNWTSNDVTLRFGQLIQVPNPESPKWGDQYGTLLERAAVTLPWHQAKVLRDMLDGIIRNYEQINGELKPLKLPAPPAPIA
ncbi:MAG: DUF3467 domain-containing protein [Bryobacteraceae bacterium]